MLQEIDEVAGLFVPGFVAPTGPYHQDMARSWRRAWAKNSWQQHVTI